MVRTQSDAHPNQVVSWMEVSFAFPIPIGPVANQTTADQPKD